MAIVSDPSQLTALNSASIPKVMPQPFGSATCGTRGHNNIGEQLAAWARTPVGLAFVITAGTLLGLVLMKLLALLGWAMDWAWLRDNPILRSGSDNCPSPAACVIAAVGAGGGSGGKHWGRGGKGPRGTGGKSPGGGGGPSGGGGTGGKPSGPPTGPDPNWTPRDPGTDPVTGRPDLSQPQDPAAINMDEGIDSGVPPEYRPYGPADGPGWSGTAETEPQPGADNPQQALSDMSTYNYPPPPPPSPTLPPAPPPPPFSSDTITQWLSGLFQ
jgi:hypothetical protein